MPFTPNYTITISIAQNLVAIEEGKKRHLNIQSKAVKKRMKKQKKKSEALNRKRSGKKKSFFARIFGGKG